MPKISQIDEIPCQAEVRILQKITLKICTYLSLRLSQLGLTIIGRGPIRMLENNIQFLERLKTLESSESALAALRRYFSLPATMFDKYETIELLRSLVRVARNENNQKGDEYAGGPLRRFTATKSSSATTARSCPL